MIVSTWPICHRTGRVSPADLHRSVPWTVPTAKSGGTAVLGCWPWGWSSWRWWGRSSSWRRVCRRTAADDSGFPLALSVAVTSWVLLRAVPRRGAAGL